MDNLLTPTDDLRFRDWAQRIIPSLNFSCDGAISKWIIRAQWNGGGTAHCKKAFVILTIAFVTRVATVDQDSPLWQPAMGSKTTMAYRKS